MKIVLITFLILLVSQIFALQLESRNDLIEDTSSYSEDSDYVLELPEDQDIDFPKNLAKYERYEELKKRPFQLLKNLASTFSGKKNFSELKEVLEKCNCKKKCWHFSHKVFRKCLRHKPHFKKQKPICKRKSKKLFRKCMKKCSL